MITTASLIRSYRASKGFSQEYVANELGIKQAAYSNIESGKSDVTLNRLQDIAQLLEISVYDLIIESNKSNAMVNEPPAKYKAGNISLNGYEVSVTIKINNADKESEILKMIGLNKN